MNLLTDPRVHGCLVRLQRFVEQERERLSPAVRSVLERKEVAADVFSVSAQERNEAFLKAHANSLPHALAAAR